MSALDKITLRALISEGRWHEIGMHFDFTPRFTTIGRDKYFNWISAPAAMMQVLGWVDYRPPKKIKKGFLQKLRAGIARHDLTSAEIRKRRLDQLFDSQLGLCFYCGKEIQKHSRQRSIDHKLPRIRGGNSSLKNLVGACKTCNQAKGGMTVEEFLDTDYFQNNRRSALGRHDLPRLKHKEAVRRCSIAVHDKALFSKITMKRTDIRKSKAFAHGLTIGWPDGDIQ